VSRWWSYFFLLLPIFGVGVFAVAPWLGWSLPENISTMGARIDFLYGVILFLTGTVFIGTQLFLFYVLFRFGDRPGRKAEYIHGSHKAEMIWTLIPAAILAGLLALQTPAWLDLRFEGKPNEKIHAKVVARRFEWRVVHAGLDNKINTPDDVVLNNELHIPPNTDVTIELQSADVVHSFFLPQLRLKQDAVPGMRIPVRFDATKTTLAFRDSHADLRPADFEDLGGLAYQLKKADRKADKFIKLKLQPATVALLEGYEPSVQPSAGLEAALLADLNRVLGTEDFAAAKEFDDVDRSPATEKDLAVVDAAKRRTEYRRLINRHLLSDAYPNVVRRLKRDYEFVCSELCGEGHFQMQGRLIVHESAADYEAWLHEAYAKQEASK
jgi:cytochrome c oxidase subunit 2